MKKKINEICFRISQIGVTVAIIALVVVVAGLHQLVGLPFRPIVNIGLAFGITATLALIGYYATT